MMIFNNTDMVLHNFELFLKAKNLSQNTLQSYKQDIKQFEKYLETQNLQMISNNYPNYVNMFLGSLQQKGMSSSTIWRKFAAIKKFYQYISPHTNISDPSALENITLPEIEKKTPTLLSPQMVDLMLNQPNESNPKGCRDKAMLELLCATGIRVSEIVCLNVGDVDLECNQICCAGKYQIRILALNTRSLEALKMYLFNTRDLLLHNKNEPALFINRRDGKRLTRQGFWKIIKQYQDNVGNGTAVTPHMFRRYAGFSMFKDGISLKDIRHQLGHADNSFARTYARIVGNSAKKCVETR